MTDQPAHLRRLIRVIAWWTCDLAGNAVLQLFSSPEHEVLKVIYYGQSVSIVRRASSVVRHALCGVNKCFKSLFLLHLWTN